MIKNILKTVVACFVLTTANAQNLEFKAGNFKDDKEGFKKATTAIKLGDESYEAGNEAIFAVEDAKPSFKKAIIEYKKAQKFNPNNAELNFKIGVSYMYTHERYLAPKFIRKAAELDSKVDPFLPYYLGLSNQLEEKYKDALKNYETFETEYKKADRFTKFVKQRKKECKSAIEITAKPERVWVDNVKEINTSADELAPAVSTDGAYMIFSSNKSNGGKKNELGEFDMNIYQTNLNNGKWSSPKTVKGEVNSNDDDFSSVLSYDGTKMLIFRKNDAGNYDVLESELKGLNWSAPVSVSRNINTVDNQTYASYNFDDVKYYFVSDKQTGSENGTDIYFSGVMDRQARKYGRPTTAGKEINTKFNEGSVYLHPDGETMYFSSEGHNSIGGMDIFVSYKKQGQWTKPINLGYPINTPYDDYFFAATASNKYAYIASNRAGGKGGMDIYKVTYWGADKTLAVDTEDFLLASVANPIKDNEIKSSVKVERKSLTVFKGKTIDAITRKPVEAVIEIIDNLSGKTVKKISTNSATGKFLISLNSGKNYGIAVKADGYLFHSENFDIPSKSAFNMVDKTVELKNIKIGSKIALRNIFFETGKSDLKSESNKELDRLVKLMKDVPGLKVEIGGHTDNVGSTTMNNKLSQARAEAVVNYLASKGISKPRMTSKGYGPAEPIATNNSSEGRQQNRRVEFKITGN